MVKASTPCRWFLVELPGYLTGELLPSEASRVGAHLEECGRCRADLERFRELDDLLVEVLEVPPSTPTFRESFFRRLAAESAAAEHGRFRSRWFWSPALVPVAAAALVALAVMTRTPDPTPLPTVADSAIVVSQEAEPIAPAAVAPVRVEASSERVSEGARARLVASVNTEPADAATAASPSPELEPAGHVDFPPMHEGAEPAVELVVEQSSG